MFIGFCLKPVSYRRLCVWYDKLISSKRQSKNVSIPSGRKHYFDETRPARQMYPFRQVVFEGELAFVPNDVDGYLHSMYGDDYMEIPPVGKRERHAFVELSIDVNNDKA